MSYKTEVLDKGMMMTWEGVPLHDLSREELIEALYQAEQELQAERRWHTPTVKTWSTLLETRIKRGVCG